MPQPMINPNAKYNSEIWLEFKANAYGWSHLKHLVSVTSLCGSLSVVDVEAPIPSKPE